MGCFAYSQEAVDEGTYSRAGFNVLSIQTVAPTQTTSREGLSTGSLTGIVIGSILGVIVLVVLITGFIFLIIW